MSSTPFFNINLSKHRVLGDVFTAHIAKPISLDNGIYAIVENVFQSNLSQWKKYLSDNNLEVLKYIEEISDSNLLKTIGRKHKTVASFYKEVESNETVSKYVKEYIERRMAKCFDLLAAEQTPVFIKDKNSNNLYDINQVSLYSKRATLVFHFSIHPEETKYRLLARHDDEILSLKSSDSSIVCNLPCIVRLGRKMMRFDGVDGKKIQPFITKPEISIPKSAERKYFETFVLNAIRDHEVEAEGFTVEKINADRKAVLRVEPLLSGHLGFSLEFKYGSKGFLCHSLPKREVNFYEQNGTYAFKYFDRNTEWEKEVMNGIEQLGLRRGNGADYLPEILHKLQPANSAPMLIDWLNQNVQGLSDLKVVIDQDGLDTEYYIGSIDIDLNSKFNNDWFDIYGTVKLDGLEIPLLKLKKNLINGIREFILPNGQILILPEHWFAKYKQLFAMALEDKGKLRLNKALFSLMDEMGVDNPDAEELRKRFINAEHNTCVEIPSGLKANLRNYQKMGFYWLQLLYKNKLGGCLADDMGLGKTLQTIALLQYIKEQRPANEKSIPSLIVLPTSLIFNWRNEIVRFAPTLKVYTYFGSDRDIDDAFSEEVDIILTSYGIARNDIETLSTFGFYYLILDEGQAIKNPASKTYRSILQLKGMHYLTLSGTPIENSIIDLWSQLNFINRGMLGSIKQFKEEFGAQTTNDMAEWGLENLKKLIKPFILRRTKDEVVKDLPAVTHQVVICNMSEKQQEVYETEKAAIQKEILKSIELVGYNKSAIAILRSLTRLRQIANHPAMIDDYPNTDSGKFDEICSSMSTIISENHKIIVFSSFVKHLKLVEKYLAANEISYQMLIGSTTNRQQVVESFNNNPSIKAFLISLKAGGVGLNLTSADYVFIIDPWWNPAAEEQAISRSHRIGQEKPVFVYRFITSNTLEEKIQKLQQKKATLAAEIVGTNNPLQVIGRDNIMNIFE
jgi:superfamily II DNA or RNA helicase